VKELINSALKQGVFLYVEDEQLKFKLKVKAFPSELKKTILANKPALIRFLSDFDKEKTTSTQLQSIKRQDFINGEIPLSLGQARIWFIDQLVGDSHQYNMTAALKVINGSFDIDLAQVALTNILKRHTVLRSQFLNVDGQPLVAIRPLESFKIEHSVLADNANVESTIKQVSQQPFDLSKDLLFQCYFLSSNEDGHKYLIFKTHHIVFDGVSLNNFLVEFKHFYQSDGEDSLDRVLPIQFYDYAAWEHAIADKTAYQESLNYWLMQLEGAPISHNLPLEYTRKDQPTKNRAVCNVQIKGENLERYTLLKQHFGLTDFMVIHGLISLVLSVYQNSPDIVIGIPTANRSDNALSNLIGFFANTIALRLDLSEQKVSAFFEQVKQVHIEAQQHQHVSLDVIIEKLGVERTTHFAPLFQVLLSVQTKGEHEIELPGCSLTSITSDNHSSDYDLDIQVNIQDNRINFQWLYNNELFSKPLIERFLNGLNCAINSLFELKEGDGNLNEVTVLTGLERAKLAQITGRINDSSKPVSFIQLFQQSALNFPENIAVRSKHKSLTYQQLDELSNYLVLSLQNEGVGQGAMIGVYMDRTVNLTAALVAIFKLGGCYVPLDKNYPLERLNYMVSDANVDIIIADVINGDLEIDNHRWFTFDDNCIRVFEQSSPQSNVRYSANNSNAYVIYTSGTTGKPKGVLISQDNLSSLLFWARQYYSTRELTTVLASTSLNFDLSVFEIFVPLSSGTTCVIVDSILSLIDSTIDDITLINTVPSGITALLDARYLPKSLEVINLAGEPLKKALVNRIFEFSINDISVCNLYGPSEDTTYSTQRRFTHPLESEPTIGQSLTCKQAIIVNYDGRLSPQGVVGEIILTGAGVAKGYLNKPQLTKEQFKVNKALLQSDVFYWTGDYGCYAGKEINFLGRQDDQIKLRGFRIELQEVEKSLNQFTMIKESCVVTDEKMQSLLAFVVVEPGFDVGKLNNDLKESLPRFMLPDSIIELAELPKNNNGKIDKNQLRKHKSDSTSINPDVAERSLSEKELIIAKIWASNLDVELDNIKASSNFFNLGGHSLLAVKVINELRKQGFSCTLQSLFNARNLTGFLQEVELNAITNINQINHIDIDSAPLSSNQYRMWFIDRMQGGSREYNMPYVFELSNDINEELLNKAFQLIIERHLPLRSIIHYEGDTLYQSLLASSNWQLELESGEQSKSHEIIAQFIDYQFDLSKDFTIKAKLLRGPDYSRPTLIVLIHHISFDLWSSQIFLTELKQSYAALLKGKQPELVSLASSYYRYAMEESNKQYSHELSYWNQLLEGAPSLHSLRTNPRPAVKNTASEYHLSSLSNVSEEQLKNSASLWNMTPFMFAHAVFSLVLSRYSYSHDIVVGTPVINRGTIETEQLIGLFANTVVLRVNTEQTSIDNYLTHIRQVHVDAQSYQDVPFELVVEDNVKDRDARFSPLFQILFTVNESQAVTSEEDIYLSEIPLQKSTAKFDLEVFLHFKAGQVYVAWHFDNTLFNKLQITRYADCFNDIIEKLLEKVSTTNTNEPLHTLFTAPHYEQLLQNSIGAEKLPLIHEVFEQSVLDSPHSICLVDRPSSLTYTQVDQRANQLANILYSKGVNERDVVTLDIDRSVWQVISILACLKLGAMYLPLDSSLPKKRKLLIIDDAGCKAYIGFHTQENRLLELTCRPNVFSFDISENIEKLSQASEKEFTVRLQVEDPAYLIYTSGSTGKPKGVIQTHQTISNLISHMNKESGNAILHSAQYTPYSFDVSIQELAMAWYTHSPLLVVKQAVKDDLYQFSNFIVTNKIGRLFVSPAALNIICDYINQTNGLSHLKEIFVAGEQFNNSRALQTFLTRHTETKVWNHYGPTETHVVAASLVNKELNLPQFTIGSAIDNTQMFVVDCFGNTLEAQEKGELFVSGAGVGLGYRGEKSTAFVNDSSKCGGYLTGDLCILEESNKFKFIERKDTQLSVNGFRVEIAEIENVLNALNEVKLAKVLSDTDNDHTWLTAYIETAQKIKSIQQVKKQLSLRLPHYMVPTKFVLVHEWPLNKNGKFDIAELKTFVNTDIEENTPLDTKFEGIVANAWRECLQETTKQMYKESNFFQLGGSSLKALKLADVLRNKFGLTFKLSAFYQTPTIESLARILVDQPENDTFILRANAGQQGYYPLTVGQESLYSIYKLTGINSAYNVQFVASIELPFELSKFTNAVEQLVTQHPILRANIIETEGLVEQVVKKENHFELNFHEISKVDKGHSNTVFKSDFNYKFDISEDPLLKISVVTCRAHNTKFDLAITVPHIIIDGKSMQVLIKELFETFRFGCANNHSKDNVSTLSFLDYALWEENYLLTSRFNKDLEFWKDTLKGVPLVHGLALERTRPKVKTFHGERVTTTYSQTLSAAVHTYLGTEKISLFNFIHGLLSLTISRFSNQDLVVIGVPLENRSVTGANDLIGYFANTLPLVANLNVEKVSSLFKQLGVANALALEHQNVPFQKIVEAVNPPRDPSISPIFQIVLNVNELSVDKADFEQWLIPINSDSCVAKFDLDLAVNVKGDQIELNWQFDTALFDKQRIASIAGYFNRLCEDIVVEHQDEILQIGYNAGLEFIASQASENFELINVPELGLYKEVVKQTKNNCDSIAVKTNDGYFSYQTLLDRANDIANQLIKLCACYETVIVLLPRNESLIAAILACSQVGVTYVPVDQNTPAKRLNYIIEDSAAKVILTMSNEKLVVGHDVTRLNIDRLISVENVCVRDADITRYGYIIYTSGTTGQPKGVIQTQYNILRLLKSSQQYFEFNASDVWCLFHSIAFDFSVWEMWGALLNGASIFIPSFTCTRSPEQFISFCDEHKVSVLNQTPTAFKLLSVSLKTTNKQLCNLRYVILGGEAVDLSTMQVWHSLVQSEHVSVINMYGITETCVHVTYKELKKGEKITAGKPLADQSIYCLSKQGIPLPSGAIGEVFVGGAGLALGYQNMDKQTENRFKTNPFICNDMLKMGYTRMYRTGDLGLIDCNGELIHMGRNDNQVQLNGHRIELSEISGELQQYDKIDKSVITVVDDNGRHYLCHFYLAASEIDNIEQLNRYLLDKLPMYMVPHRHIYVNDMPLTTNGKIDLQILSTIALSNSRQGSDIVVEGNEWTSQCLEVIRQVLKNDTITLGDEFFAVGGDSIKAVAVVSKLQKLGLSIAIKDIYLYQNIGLLIQNSPQTAVRSSNINSMTTHSIPIKELSLTSTLDIEDCYFVSSMQEEMLNQLDKGLGVYHPQQLIEFTTTNFDLLRLNNALNELAKKHIALRSVFLYHKASYCQVVLKDTLHEITLNDLSGYSPEGSRKQMEVQISEELADKFIIQESNWRFKVFKLPKNGYGFFISVNHAVEDGWGMTEFLNELFQLYCLPSHSPIDVLPDCVKELAVLERQSIDFTTQNDYWTTQAVTREFEAVNIAPNKNKPLVSVIRLNKIQSNTIRKVSKQLSLPVKSLFISCFVEVVNSVFGQSEIVIDAITSKRLPELSEPLCSLGLFWSFCPIKVHYKKEQKTLLTDVAQRLIEADANSVSPRKDILKMMGLANSDLVFAFKYVDFYNNSVGSSKELTNIRRTYSADIFCHPVVINVGVDNNREFYVIVETKLVKDNDILNKRITNLMEQRLNKALCASVIEKA